MQPLKEAAEGLDIELDIWPTHDMGDEARREACIKSFEDTDVVLIHPTNEEYWDDIIAGLRKDLPTISLGHDSTFWWLSNLRAEIIATVNLYHVYGGVKNMRNMLLYIGKEVLGKDYEYEYPEEMVWQGIYHPEADRVFDNVNEYLEWYAEHKRVCRRNGGRTVGILFFRTYWVNGDLEVVNALIHALEDSDFDVIAVFSYGAGDKDLGAISSKEVIESFFKGRIDALINLQSVFNARNNQLEILKQLDVPVFHPVIAYHQTEEEWVANTAGLSSLEVGWSVAMPEMEGLIEPLLVGVLKREGGIERHVAVDDRVKRIVARVKRWIDLRNKPVSERKVAFILHNNPCASVESTVGTAANLDALESVARILRDMRAAGYSVRVPENGKALIDDIMRRKAISEFRWTTIDEIVNKGGVLALVSKDEYERWFATLPLAVREKTCAAWGEPPGEAMNGVPAAMVYEGKIVVTGVRYGNAVVCVQPKRGCAGSRCDGRVCKILHDPEVPPPHQYLATYHYLDTHFDVIVHVGTHGNLEFLPGKSVALSGACYPDIAMGDIPHLYIYNSDNPPEGTIAKRRSYATLIDHLQAVMTESGLYGDLKELETQIEEYNRTKGSDNARSHAIEHIIIELLRRTKLDAEIKLDSMLEGGYSIERIIEAAHEAITRIYNTQIPAGMHIFGEIPEGNDRVEFINSILRYDSELRKVILALMGRDISPSDAGSALLEEVDRLGKEYISAILSADAADPYEVARQVLKDRLRSRPRLQQLRDKILDLSARIAASDEIGSLLHGFDGGYIEPGPSGLLTRGKTEILPTGRNFYSLDPFRIPSQAAWEIGKKLAEGVLRKYVEDKGKLPENIAMYWMASDIMWADGEQMAQILYLIGVEPIWHNGRVKGYRVIPLEELGRPRIDVTLRVSGIIRDCFYNCIELVDEAIRTVAVLDEPEDKNYLRKHLRDNGDCARIFASKPGTYGNGVNLAVYASAWKNEKDLADVFLEWNGYAYGKKFFGIDAHDTLKTQLETVELTFNKTTTDEYDLCGCCCYFGTHGGLTAAARALSHGDVCAYYGDTRDRDRIEVRTLADEIRRVVRSKILNPRWIEAMKRHGYKGAGDISERIGRVYGWEATTGEVDDWIFNDIARTFVLDRAMREFFERNNPWALEEIGRRLLEAYERGLWKPDEDVIEGLRSAYLEMEGWMEEKMGEVKGEFQGGTIDIITPQEVNKEEKRQ